MGNHEGWAQPSGLLGNEATSVFKVLDPERWSRAEERTAELIACIQPNQSSEEHRNAVTDYVQRLIMKCFSCQVFIFGSVPLKTYLPDGDIDLTIWSKNQNLKDTWAKDVRDILENEGKNENAEFHVKEVQYIGARVNIIKCLIENIVVDISFNELSGLCALCFFEEVDNLINQNHLFKRSIILIKAWCYYESRILGSRYRLISTYALVTLVLYIFHVFNNSFAGPLEVLYCFLEFFSNFDWDNFCVGLWGPVPISSLPEMIAEPPRKDSGELLLSKLFLDACSSTYSVPGSQENQGQPFVPKHFNIIDPLCTNDNLGRGVNKGNSFRIRSAFALGAERLARLLDCPKENLIAEVNKFFMNTWNRHGNGRRPDAPSPDLWPWQPLNPDHIDGSVNLKNYLSRKKMNENSTGHVFWQEQDANSTGGFNPNNLSFQMLSTMGTEMAERTTGPASVASSHVRSHQIHGYEPIAPILVSSGSRKSAMDNSGVVPSTFYPTGPPVPFRTKLPVYNFPTETGNSDASSSNFDREEVLDNIRIGRPDSMKETASEEHKCDILNSDFASHWQNLQFGGLCHNSHNVPSPVVPPKYLQGHFPWDGPGRPLSTNVNFFTQLMNYGSRSIPVTPIQPGSNRPASTYQRYGNEIPRYRGGTGTYLPNSVS
ncbi:hypothetical protein HHK36_001287 [Tetracentron sinense]|uniref:Polymerase nucleotidyl transferase domain-containing protein n=1 Tax=Tetracentron sinense TaxID=13715 RepID=A0A834ZSL7_TETSI|nr:hypothetical protein HHK36_001287 [Tetracentron sinense]